MKKDPETVKYFVHIGAVVQHAVQSQPALGQVSVSLISIYMMLGKLLFLVFSVSWFLISKAKVMTASTKQLLEGIKLLCEPVSSIPGT